MLAAHATLELRGFTITGARYCNVVCGTLDASKGYVFGTQIVVFNDCRVVGGGGALARSGVHGIFGTRMRLADLQIQDSGGEGVYAVKRVSLERVTITGSGQCGVRGDASVRATETTITGSGRCGIRAYGGHVRLAGGSTVVGNGVSTDCGPYPKEVCADLISGYHPRVGDSTCGTSYGKPYWLDGFDWDVCALD